MPSINLVGDWGNLGKVKQDVVDPLVDATNKLTDEVSALRKLLSENRLVVKIYDSRLIMQLEPKPADEQPSLTNSNVNASK